MPTGDLAALCVAASGPGQGQAVAEAGFVQAGLQRPCSHNQQGSQGPPLLRTARVGTTGGTCEAAAAGEAQQNPNLV